MASVDAFVTRILRRLPYGDQIVKIQGRLGSFAEQGMQGVANLLVNVILARNLTETGFATIGLMIGIHFFVLGLHRTALVLPFILDASGDEDEAVAAERRWWWVNILAVALIGVLLAVVAAIVAAWFKEPSYEWAREAIYLTVIVTPSLLLFEFGRRVLYQRRLPVTAAFASTIYLVLNLGSAWLFTRNDPSAMVGGLAWVVAGLGGWIVATIATPPGAPQFREGLQVWYKNKDFAFWQGLTNLPYAVYNSSVTVVIGIFGGSVAVAGFSAARTLANPAISMVTAVDSLDKPRAARALASSGLPGLRHSVGKTRKLLALLCGGYLALIIAFAGPILQFAFGDTYQDQVNELRLLALAFFLICMNQPSETFIIVLRQSKVLLVTRIIAAIAAVLSLQWSAPYGLMGICLALLFAHAFNLLNLRIAEWSAARRWYTIEEKRLL